MSLCSLSTLTSRADLALETETGDLGKKGESNFSQGVQFDHDHDGHTSFLLNQYEYAITNKLVFIAEIFGDSKSAAGEKGAFAGAVALEYEINKHFNFFVSVGYDTDHTFSVRPGFNLPF